MRHLSALVPTNPRQPVRVQLGTGRRRGEYLPSLIHLKQSTILVWTKLQVCPQYQAAKATRQQALGVSPKQMIVPKIATITTKRSGAATTSTTTSRYLAVFLDVTKDQKMPIMKSKQRIRASQHEEYTRAMESKRNASVPPGE